jgi:hypothetical protein
MPAMESRPYNSSHRSSYRSHASASHRSRSMGPESTHDSVFSGQTSSGEVSQWGLGGGPDSATNALHRQDSNYGRGNGSSRGSGRSLPGPNRPTNDGGGGGGGGTGLNLLPTPHVTTPLDGTGLAFANPGTHTWLTGGGVPPPSFGLPSSALVPPPVYVGLRRSFSSSARSVSGSRGAAQGGLQAQGPAVLLPPCIPSQQWTAGSGAVPLGPPWARAPHAQPTAPTQQLHQQRPLLQVSGFQAAVLPAPGQSPTPTTSVSGPTYFLDVSSSEEEGGGGGGRPGMRGASRLRTSLDARRAAAPLVTAYGALGSGTGQLGSLQMGAGDDCYLSGSLGNCGGPGSEVSLLPTNVCMCVVSEGRRGCV